MQMVLAPQLRQSLELLQVPILDLHALIQQEIEQNPTLEERPGQDQTIEIEPGGQEGPQDRELDFKEEFETLARLDEEWKDYFFQNERVRPYTSSDAEKRQFFLDSLPQKESLQEHLLNQLAISGLKDEERQIGELIIGSTDDDGYLKMSIEEIAASTGTDPGQAADVLAVIQKFDPVGVGARDLRECLMIQLERLDKEHTLAATIVGQHLDALGKRQYQEIAHALKVSPEDVLKAARFVATLEPKPGRMYNTESSTYVLPEVVVRKVDGKYVVILNNDQVPHLRVSRHYMALMKNPTTSAEVKAYIRERVRSGVFLIKSIHQRQQTIYRIACEIVEKQTGFLDKGIAHLRPLTMAEVARNVGVHETTVSRAIANKYMQTPVGLFEMKYFFTPGVKTADGRELSNKTVKGMIADLVNAEDSQSPLSDQEIQDTLKERGIKVARRTITKYRLELNIPPSHMRKGL
ncbi:MAG: RNA polymerase factor sigma-54 [Kiritimatiellae bacterium]|nr:RNA polymerase factor sigma-54 [Kiritimatiellia bacterium]